MEKVAFITPWPPQPTGIGDFAFDLISDLVKYDISITVYTDCEQPEKIDGIEIFNVNGKNINELNRYDLIVYQMGNNIHFHLHMLDLIKEFGGIVHLHDMVLHHLMGWLTWMQRDPPTYLALIEKWYGEYVSLLCAELLKREAMPWEIEIVTDLPLFEEALQHADACIVNSEFAKKKVLSALPYLNVYQITHALKGMNIVEKKNSVKDSLHIGIFGYIEPYKAVDTILESLSDIAKYEFSWTAHIVGEIGEKCKHICTLPTKLGFDDKVIFYGRLEDNEFKKKISEMDMIISLRYPTMGETSGVVTRAMQMGIPVIVSETGWYSELPYFIDKVPLINMRKNLTKILIKYFTQKGYIEEQRSKFIRYSKEVLNVESIIKRYHSILKEEAKLKCHRIPYMNISELFKKLRIRDKFTMQNTAIKLHKLIK